MNTRFLLLVLPPALLAVLTTVQAAETNPFDAAVLDVRPRIFVRNDARFDGLTVPKLRERLRQAEFDAAGARDKWRTSPLGRAILWMVEDRKEDLDAAIAGLKRMDAGGTSWSDRGPALMQLAALFDWLEKQLDEPTRREVIAKIEKNADEAVVHVRRGQAPFFYSRTPGALAGLAVAGLALHGASPKADGYLQTFRGFGVNEYFRAYDWVDGAATGATYTMNYTYVDLPSILAAWWSATGRNPNDWVRAQQGDWLDDIVRFYFWYMRPGFAFTHINDQFRGDWASHDEFCQGLDIASYVTRNSWGRAWSQRWLGRCGAALYHPVYAHNLIFRDLSLSSKPLTELPHAELFGRESCGYGFFRSGWPAEGQPDTATHVFFRCGDPMDVHGGLAAGEFQVFKHAPLADRSGRYTSYDSPPDQYHRHCISANVVLFTDSADAADRGDQNNRLGLKTDHATWQQWLDIRQRNGLDVATITDWKVAEGEARCRADLTKANPPTKCKRWLREFVWLANKHLVVLDVVEAAQPGVRMQWQLHLPELPQVAAGLLTVTNRAPPLSWADERLRPTHSTSRLFCRTLLPKAYTLVLHADGQAESFDAAGHSQGKAEGNSYHLKYGRKVIQIEPVPATTRTVFLHVLTAVDTDRSQPPKATCRATDPGQIEVAVDGSVTRLSVPESLTR
jgi:hypothetical protein